MGSAQPGRRHADTFGRGQRGHRPQLPVIFLTASDDEFNTVAGLSMGADDYVAKPFRPRELLARIRTVLRRSQPAMRVLHLGDVAVDPVRARATNAGRELDLSAVEYRLLLLFASNASGIVTRDMMREALWEDSGAYVEENALTVYICRLRRRGVRPGTLCSLRPASHEQGTEHRSPAVVRGIGTEGPSAREAAPVMLDGRRRCG
ncbi:MAG: response regulator transcription factor [Atopobiaceae bacterium]